MRQILQHRNRRRRSAIILLAAIALTASACSGATPTSGQNESVEPVSIRATESDAVHGHERGADDHGSVMALVDPMAATHVASASGRWSSASTWVGGVEPAPGARVHIPADVTVTVDRVVTPEVKTIRVDGTLRFDPDVDTALMVDTLVTAPGGTLEIGTAVAPIGPDVTARVIFADDGPIDRGWDPTLVSRGAILHGTTVIHGSEKRSFVAVSAFPQAGDTAVRLAEAPTGWRPGDQIVVAGTDPSDPTSDERRTITSVEGSVVGIDAPLVLDHAAPRADLEVHVANLTRNVTFSSENSEIGRRGHVMIMHTNNATIDHAAFRGLGRSDKARGYDDIEFVDLNPYLPAEVLGGGNVRGRYSLHFHRGGTDRNLAPARVNGSVVSDDPGWGFVNHSSHVAFTDNVAYDIVGAAYYTEAGDEIGSFTGNIAIRIVNPNLPLKAGAEGDEFDPDARESRQDYGFQGDGMWLHSPNVSVENNVFSGVSGHALIVWPEGMLERTSDGSTTKVFHDAGNVPGGELIGPAGTRMQVMDVPIGSFTGNQAYSATRGVQLYYLHTEFFGTGIHDEDCTIDPPAAYDDQLRSTFANSIIWNVDQVAFAAPYANRITLDGLRIVGGGSGDAIGIDVGHFMNERGIEIRDVTVEGFATGVRINATADVTLSGDSLSNRTDVEYVIPDEDGEGQIVDGPRRPDIDEPERDNSHLQTCIPGQPPADMELDGFDDEEEFDDEFDDDEFDDEEEFDDDEFDDD